MPRMTSFQSRSERLLAFSDRPLLAIGNYELAWAQEVEMPTRLGGGCLQENFHRRTTAVRWALYASILEWLQDSTVAKVGK